MARPRDFDVDCKVYVGELGHGCSKDELEEKFSKYGSLRNVWVARRPAGFAFIEFDDRRDAEDACKALDGARINGRRAKVEMSTGRSRSGGGRHGGGPPPRGGPRYDDYRPARRSMSPRRQRSISPRRGRSPSPRRGRSPSPRRGRSPSPRRARSNSRSASPKLRKRSRSYERQRSASHSRSRSRS